jgi:hypothetical protein
MKVLLVDVSNTVMRYSATMEKAKSRNGLPIGGLYGVLATIRKLVAAEGFDAAIAVMDYGVPKYRLDLYPEYKGQRKTDRAKDPKQEQIYLNYKEQLPYVPTVLQHTGVATARAKGWEADDVIAALALIRLADHQITIATSDADFTTIASDRIKVYNPITELYREPDPLYCLKKAINPKRSDNLVGITGLGDVKSQKVTEAWAASTVDYDPTPNTQVIDFLAWCDRNKAQDKLCAAVIAEQQQLRINIAITDMFESAKMCNDLIKFRRNTPDKAGFMGTCRDFGFIPFLESLSSNWPPLSNLKCPV